MKGFWKTLLAGILMAVLSLAAYSNSFHAEFHLDDYHQIVNNHNIRDLSNVPVFFTDAGLGTGGAGVKVYRPVTIASFAINYALSGQRVWSYHLFNILLHILNALFVYLIVRDVMKKGGASSPCMPAFLASVIFAAHPIETSAVTYISGRSVLLATAFYLLAFLGFLRLRAGDGPGRYAWAAAAPAFYLSGLLSKEMAVSLICIMAAYDFILVLPVKRTLKERAWLAAYYVPFIAVLAAFVALKIKLQGAVGEPINAYSRWAYLLSEAKTLLMYARLLVLPINQNADYNLPATVSVDILSIAAFFSVGIVLYLLFRFKKKTPQLVFFGLWFLIAIVPESSLFPIADIAVEHRLYLPSVGFIAMAVLLAGRLIMGRALRRTAAVTIVLLLAVLTFSRNEVWADGVSLWGDAASKSPGSARAHINLGKALERAHRYADAVPEFMLAIKLIKNPAEKAASHAETGRCFAGLKKYRDAYIALESAQSFAGKDAGTWTVIGEAYYWMGDYASAARALLRSVSLNPDYDKAHLLLAKSYSRLGRRKEALAEVEAALRLSPGDYVTSYDAAVIYAQDGAADRAISEARRALSLAGNEYERKAAESLIAGLGGEGRGGGRPI